MEYVIHDSDIFDPTLAEKFDAVILSDNGLLEEKKVYEIIASFHVDLIKHLSEFELFVLPPSHKTYKRKKYDEKDKIYDVLSFQLKQLENILVKNNIEFYSSTIKGDQIESTHIIKIELVEDETELVTLKKGKKQPRGKVSSVIPSIIYTQNLITKLKSERLNKLFDEFFRVIRNKKILSEILEIDETNNDDLLFKAFVKQYGDLWLTTSAREKELRDKLLNKAIEVIEKYHKESVE